MQLAYPVDAVVVLVHPLDCHIHSSVTARPRRRRASLASTVGARGDLNTGAVQRRADRLDPELCFVPVDVVVD